MLSPKIEEELDDDSLPEKTADKESEAVTDSSYYKRREEFNTEAHRVRVIGLRVFAGLVIVGFTLMTIVWLFHLISPWRWLETNDLIQIKAILIGVFLGGISSFLTSALAKFR